MTRHTRPARRIGSRGGAGDSVMVGGRVLPLPPGRIRRVAQAVLAGERRRAMVSITFLGPTAMRRLNRRYLGHDRATDVLAFPLLGPDGGLAGDVYICRAVAAREAQARRIPEREEVTRLIVHGVLHVLGYDHPTGPRRTASKMWRRQERYVRKLA
ncbi:MAG TPA: rRNA maturation RNase YbeY [Gemmatimonadales bacterium]|nr:rRNA maturation RNase YbeY [Gemmatimonadales bacterium]